MSKKQERKDLVKGRPGTAINVFKTWKRKIREALANALSPSKITGVSQGSLNLLQLQPRKNRNGQKRELTLEQEVG